MKTCAFLCGWRVVQYRNNTNLLVGLWPLDGQVRPDAWAAMPNWAAFVVVAPATPVRAYTTDTNIMHLRLSRECQHWPIAWRICVRHRAALCPLSHFCCCFRMVSTTVEICWMAGFHWTISFVPILLNCCWKQKQWIR